jgi:hypothetical protein
MTDPVDVSIDEVYDVMADSELAVVMVPADDEGAEIYTVDNTDDETDPEQVAMEMLAGMGVQMDFDQLPEETDNE